MLNKPLYILIILLVASQIVLAQDFVAADSVKIAPTQDNATNADFTANANLPVIEYASVNPKYTIADITITGAGHYEDFVLIGFSGLAIGDEVSVPGEEISASVKRFWKQGLFSDVKINATKIEDGKVWLNIALKERPRVSQINYNGFKKSELDELKPRLGIAEGNQITPNISDRAKKFIEKFISDKGFLNVEANVYQRDDPEKPGFVIVDIDVDKKLKTKVNKIYITGNEVLSDLKVDLAMKKTNEKRLINFFRSKKFVNDEFENDKNALIEKYNEIGYRDAYIVADSVVAFNDKSVNVYLTIDEGKKYYFRDIKWVGNTIYPYQQLDAILGIRRGDAYNYKHLSKRLFTDEGTAVSKLYQDRGYLFSQIDPVEIMIDGDSIDFEMRIYEGKQATINEIKILGNDRVYEHVVRRELRTKPGQLYSQSDIIRTLRELAQMGHFDPERITPDILPNMENGTVDINYNLETKSSDQVEASFGWGATGIVGSIGLKFSNFSIQNIFRPSTYRIVPQGEGQTFSVNVRSNGKSYSSASISFFEPWFGGKRPNSFSASAYYSTQSAIADRYLRSMYSNPYYNSYYGSSYGGGYGGGYDDYYQNMYLLGFDPNKYMRTVGVSLGYGKRLTWPDDYFFFSGELSYQLFMLKDWYASMFPMTEGTFHNLSLNLSINRNSIDNPIYTRSGSSFSLGLKITPPYSLFDGKDYSQRMSEQDRYRFIEYHKWTFSGKMFTPLTPNNKALVLMTRIMSSYVGEFNKNKRSPFETFYMGGDGMSAYTSYGTDYIAMRGYESGSLTPYILPNRALYDEEELKTKSGSFMGYMYNKFTMELRFPVVMEQSVTAYALGFLEAGNSFASIKHNPFDLKRSAGLGVRIFLPMFGMMGIDWAYGFDTVNGKRGGSNFHFVLGQEL
jgi:Outer membrane protein/protective antigen OMA87